MTAPAPLLALLAVLIASASAKMHAVILGQPVTMSALWLVAAALVLILFAAVLILARLLIQDGLRLRPVKVGS